MMNSFSDIRQRFAASSNERESRSAERMRILLIDDNLEICAALTEILGDLYEVVSAVSLNHAIPELQAGVALVLLDVKMPQRDGIESFRYLKHRWPELPIVFHTAYPGGSSEAEVMAGLPHDGCLTKGSYSDRDVLAAIEAALARAQGRGLPSGQAGEQSR